MLKPPKEALKPLYQRWLNGESLRKICLNTDYKFQSLHCWFKKDFGLKATDFKSNSLSRSLLEDYKDKPQIVSWVKANHHIMQGDETLYRSQATLNQHSRKTSYETKFICNVIERQSIKDEPETWDFLRLPFYQLQAKTIVVVLENILNTTETPSVDCIR